VAALGLGRLESPLTADSHAVIDRLSISPDPFPEVDVEPPQPSNGSAVSLHLQVADCDAVAAAAVRMGARLDRGPESSSHGRSATFHDPFGHRWMINS
jgi:PhnB protein